MMLLKKVLLLCALAALPSAAQTVNPGAGGGGTVKTVTPGCGLTSSPNPVVTTGTISDSIVTAAHNGSYAILTGDCGKSLTTNTAAAWTIAQSGTAGFAAGWYVIVNNVGAGSLTVTATTSTFYGGPSANISGSVLTVPTLTSATIISDGANYQVLSGGGGVAPNGSSTDILTSNGVGGFGTSLPVPLAANKGGTGLSGSLTGARKANGAGVDTQAACADLSNAGSGCSSGGIPSGTGAVYSSSGVGALVSGTASNCVLVNGTSAPCDAPGQAAVSNKTPITATNPTTATALQQLTLSAGLLNIDGNLGGIYTYSASGHFTIVSALPTLTWRLHACVVSVCASGTDRTVATIVTPSVTSATNNVWNMGIKIINTATGSSGTLFGHGSANVELTASSDLASVSSDSNAASTASIDLTGVVYMYLTVQTSGAGNAGDIIIDDQSSLEPASAIGPTGATGTIPTYLPTCTDYTVTFSGANWTVTGQGTQAISAATSQTITVASLAANAFVTSVRIKQGTAFAGTSWTATTFSLGSNAGATTQFSPAFDVFQAVSSTAFWIDGGAMAYTTAPDTLTGTFISTGGNLTAISAGSLNATVCVAVMP